MDKKSLTRPDLTCTQMPVPLSWNSSRVHFRRPIKKVHVPCTISSIPLSAERVQNWTPVLAIHPERTYTQTIADHYSVRLTSQQEALNLAWLLFASDRVPLLIWWLEHLSPSKATQNRDIDLESTLWIVMTPTIFIFLFSEPCANKNKFTPKVRNTKGSKDQITKMNI